MEKKSKLALDLEKKINELIEKKEKKKNKTMNERMRGMELNQIKFKSQLKDLKEELNELHVNHLHQLKKLNEKMDSINAKLSKIKINSH